MRIEQLQYLVEVAEAGSINLTAQKYYVTQQSLSEAIRKLEKEFDTEFLERSYKGVHLTDKGKLFVEKAKVILNNIEELKKEFQSNKASEVSPLKGNLKIIISALPLMDNNLLHNALTLFNKKHPKVNIIIGESDFQNAISSVSTNNANIGIITATEKLLTGDDPLSIKDFYNKVIFEELYSDKIVMCVGKMLPLAYRKSISFKEAIKYPIIVYQPNNNETSDNSWYINRLKTLGNIKNFIVASNSDIYKESIVKGNAIGYSSLSYLEANPSFKNEITVLSIRGYCKLTCGWIRSKNYDPSEAAKEFINLWCDLEHHRSNTSKKGTRKTVKPKI